MSGLPLHLKFHTCPHLVLLFRVLGDRSLYVLGEAAPCLPCGVEGGRVALVALGPDSRVRLVGGALHVHEFFEGVCHVQGSYVWA